MTPSFLSAVHALSALAAVSLASPDLPWFPALAALPVAFAPWVPVPKGGSVRLLAGLAAAVVVAVWLGVAEPPLAALVAIYVHQRLLPDARSGAHVLAATGALMFVAAATRTVSPWFLPAWLVWTATLPSLLEAARPWPRIGRLGLAWVALAALIFVLLPRSARTGVDPKLLNLRGLAHEVRLGGFAVGGDPLVVAEVQFLGGSAEEIRLRGASLDRFDGARWTSTVPKRAVPWTVAWAAARDVEVHQVDLGGLLLTPGAVERAPVGASQDLGDSWWGPGTVFGWRVAIDYPHGTPDLTEKEAQPFLQSPALSSAVRALAERVAPGEADPRERLVGISRFLADDFAYDPSSPARDLEDFLLSTRRGDCVAYATSAVILARAAGIPARLVVGFVRGEAVPGGRRFRASGAHAWAEAHVDGVGWLEVDATPGGVGVSASPLVESRPSVGPSIPSPFAPRPPSGSFDLTAAAASFDRADQGVAVGMLAGLALVVGCGGLVARWWRSRPRSAPRRGVAGELDRAFGSARRRGWPVDDTLPPLEAARRVVGAVGSAGRPLEELAWMYYEVAYGGAAEEPLWPRARALADTLEGR